MGVRLVEIGHAERRRLFGESTDVVRQKVAAAWRNGLVPHSQPMSLPSLLATWRSLLLERGAR